MKNIHSKSNSERGATVVEASLILILLLTFIFTLFDFSWILFRHQTLVHTARNAARWAAVNPSNLDAVKNVVLYGNAAGTGPGVFGLDASNIAVNRLDTGTADDRIKISITGYQMQFFTLGHAGTFTGKPITVSIPVEN